MHLYLQFIVGSRHLPCITVTQPKKLRVLLNPLTVAIVCLAWCRHTKAKARQALQSGEGLAFDPNAPSFDPVPDTDFDPIHIVHWEQDIVWDQQDESADPPSAEPLVEEDDWAEFDRDLGYDNSARQQKNHARQVTSVPVLEPLPQRPTKGELCHCLLLIAQTLHLAYCIITAWR